MTQQSNGKTQHKYFISTYKFDSSNTLNTNFLREYLNKFIFLNLGNKKRRHLGISKNTL